MSPVQSWAVFVACIAVGLIVYVIVAGGRRYRQMERDAFTFTQWSDGFTGTPTQWVRVLPSVYDHEARGDFDHDPIRDHEWCDGCNALLRRAFNRLADYDLGPRDADMLMAAIRKELKP
jgi:hypothetical protein